MHHILSLIKHRVPLQRTGDHIGSWLRVSISPPCPILQQDATQPPWHPRPLLPTGCFLFAFGLVPLLAKAKTGKQLKGPSIDEWVKKTWPHTTHKYEYVNITQPWKRRKSCHLQQHRRILRELCKVKAVRQRELLYRWLWWGSKVTNFLL